jgi:hypothetical protein
VAWKDRNIDQDSQDGTDLQSGRPLVLQNIETDTAQFINVRMAIVNYVSFDIGDREIRKPSVLNFGKESDFGWVHWVFFGQEQLELEYTAYD